MSIRTNKIRTKDVKFPANIRENALANKRLRLKNFLFSIRKADCYPSHVYFANFFFVDLALVAASTATAWAGDKVRGCYFFHVQHVRMKICTDKVVSLLSMCVMHTHMGDKKIEDSDHICRGSKNAALISKAFSPCFFRYLSPSMSISLVSLFFSLSLLFPLFLSFPLRIARYPAVSVDFSPYFRCLMLHSYRNCASHLYIFSCHQWPGSN